MSPGQDLNLDEMNLLEDGEIASDNDDSFDDMRSEGLEWQSHRRKPTRTNWISRATPPICWHWRAQSKVIRLLKYGPALVVSVLLMLFGLVHILQIIMGRSSMWNDEFATYFAKIHGHLHANEMRQSVRPIPCHSHNDYWRQKPLFDALNWGCVSVEADVWHLNGDLYVGHSFASLSKDWTLSQMYLDPLLDILRLKHRPRDNVTGIFDRSPEQTLVLLVDFKTPGEETFDVLRSQLSHLRDAGYLSFWDGEMFRQRAVTVVATGNAPFDSIIANTTYRDVFFDAPLSALWQKPHDPIEMSDSLHETEQDVDYGTAMAFADGDGDNISTHLDGTALTSFNASTSYYASTSFFSSVGFVWRGHLSPSQMDIIRGQIRGAKRQGLKVRYWDTPSWPASLRNHVWHVLVKEGVDVLNIDDLEAAALQDWTAPVHDWFF